MCCVLITLSTFPTLCVYLQYQEEKRRGRKRKDDSEMKDENVPPHRAKAKRRQEQPKSVQDKRYDLTTDIENDSSTSECVTTSGYEKLTQGDLDRLQQERG